MLILSRSVDQKIIIGKNIEVTVVAIEGNQVRVWIEAPESVLILREELLANSTRQESGRLLAPSFGRLTLTYCGVVWGRNASRVT